MLKHLTSRYNFLDEHTTELAKGALIALVLKVGGAALSYSFSVLVARELRAAGMGVYSLALTITTFASAFGKLGLDLALLRFVAANASIEEWGKVRGAYKRGILLALVASGLTTVLLLVLAPWLAESVFSMPELTWPLRWMSLAIAPVAILNLTAEALRALKHILRSQLIRGVCLPALSMVGLTFLVRAWRVTGAAWTYTLAALLTAALGVWFWQAEISRLPKASTRSDTRQLLHSSIPLFWVEIMNLITNWTGTWALGVWATREDVGIFSAASRTAMIIGFFLAAVSSISAPQFGALHARGDRETLGHLARRAAGLTALVAMPLTLLFVFVPSWVMGAFGPQFVQGANSLVVLSLGQFANAMFGPVGYLLIMTGHEPLFRNSVTLSAFLNVALSLLLVPRLGVLGAATATAVSVVALKISLVYMVWSRLRVWPVPLTLRERRGQPEES
ncbi:MAG: flippase [Planctomycetota bacterium]|jgi:O-antigen/teichoic acid export membrane protein